MATVMKVHQGKFEIIADYYIAHYDELLGFVKKQLQYADEAEDIVQNVFLRLLSTDKMISPVTLPCMAYTIARNLVYDYWRHHQSIEAYEHYLKYARVVDDLDVGSVYSVVEIYEILERGMARLSDTQQVVYRMNFCEGLPVSEISKTLQMNYKSVEHRLGTARKVMRQYIEKMLA